MGRVYGTVLSEKLKPDKTRVSRYWVCTRGLSAEAQTAPQGGAARGTGAFPAHGCAVGFCGDWGSL